MKTNLMNKSIIALFNDLGMAEQAVQNLESAGFSRGDMSLFQRDNSTTHLSDIVDLGIGKDEADDLENGFTSGHVIVTLNSTTNYQSALKVLNESNAKTIITSHSFHASDDTNNSPNSLGHNLPDNYPTAGNYSMNIADTINTDIGDIADLEKKGIYKSSLQDFNLRDNEINDKQKLKLHAEQLDITKNAVESGEVVIRKEIITETKTIEVPVTREEIVVERHNVNKHIAGNITDNVEEVARIAVSEEQVNVTKVPVVKEKINVKKIQVTENQQVSAPLLHEELEVNESGNIIVENNHKQI